MITEQKHLLTIGYAKHALQKGSREHDRMLMYANHLASLHIIVFTSKKDGFTEPICSGKLTVHPTNSLIRPLMIIDAIRLGVLVIWGSSKRVWVISSQDAFEAGFVGRILSIITRSPHSVQLHGDNFSGTSWRSEALLNWLRYWFGVYILKTADSIRVASERLRRSLVELSIPDNKIVVLPIRPELELFLDLERPSHKPGKFTFLATSRFSSEKNIPLILRAFSRICSSFPEARLRIIGKGKEEARIRALIQSLHIETQTETLHWTEHVEDEMQQADVFLSASNHEAYGLTLLEAIASGLPVITTDVGCVGEVILDGVHGIVVPVGNEDAFVAAMRRMLTDHVFRMEAAKAGKKTAKQLAQVTAADYAKAWVAAHTRT